MKKLLIIGAGFLQDFVIKRANEMGYETIAVDGNPEAIGFQHAKKHEAINIIDENACLEYAKKEKINGVITAATDFGVLTTSYIAKELKLPGLDYSVAKLIKNKYLVRKCLYENHVDDTEQAFEVNKKTNIALLANYLKYPVMVKPCDGSGSRGTTKVNSCNELAFACELAMDNSISGRAEIETFIDGKEYGVESFVVNGEISVLGIMKKWMTAPPYYAELGHAIPSGLSVSIENKVKQCVINAIKSLGINYGSVNMDIIITKEGKIYIIDIGARMGGNMIGPCIIPYGTGIDYVGAMIQSALGEFKGYHKTTKSVVVSRILSFKDGIVREIPDITCLEEKYNVEIYHHMYKGMKVNEYHTNLDGCGYIIAKSELLEDAIRNVNEVYSIFEQVIV